MAHVDTMIQQLKHIYHERVNENQEHDGEIYRAKAIKIDLNQWLYWYATDVITDLTIGESLHGLQNLETAPYLQFLTVAPKLLLKAAVLSHLGLGAMVDLMAQIFAGQFSQMSADLTQRLKSQHGRKLEKRGDLAELMTEANKIRLLTDEQLLGTANFLVIAGSETITLTLTAFIYFVASNPKHLSRLKHEIHSAFQADHEITLKRTEKLEFLNACLKEALRISPAVAGGPPRVVAKGGRLISGVFVPQDASPSLSA
ncbi:hypothetical protein EG328_008656 [Venturia inaequalis]|nr:hypothetical protein EG328_008656 [Venturia inaequalis]RDI84677.1 hypothetical protein Vi05172_g5259 [Venturia inaequalis]